MDAYVTCQPGLGELARSVVRAAAEAQWPRLHKGQELEPSEPSDLELLRSAAVGDEPAFHRLMDRHAPGLFRLALSLAGSRSDAEDICQETFAGAFKSLKGFKGGSTVKTWLTKILIRRAAKIWHKERHGRRSISIDAAREAANGESRSGHGSLDLHLSVPSAASKVDHRLDVMEVIRTLSPEHRDVIVLRELQGLSYEEIAASLNVPRGTVESRLHRARGELRKKLEGYEF